MIRRINDENFINEVLKSVGLVIVDFSANWCGPCQMLAPVLENISNRNENIKIVRVDIDDSPKVSQRYSIRSIPMLMFFKDGKIVDEIVGFVPEYVINEAINDNL